MPTVPFCNPIRIGESYKFPNMSSICFLFLFLGLMADTEATWSTLSSNSNVEIKLGTGTKNYDMVIDNFQLLNTTAHFSLYCDFRP